MADDSTHVRLALLEQEAAVNKEFRAFVREENNELRRLVKDLGEVLTELRVQLAATKRATTVTSVQGNGRSSMLKTGALTGSGMGIVIVWQELILPLWQMLVGG